ncbi:MoxR-like ATPase [Paenibacillus mucilaginosus]|uniref:AAA family ATPase n=1 Tax=Paenibacillus mucilaginosus TaxID=61624 RepID=UPI003D197974
MKYTRNALKPILALQYKEKMIDYVSRIQQAVIDEKGDPATYVKIDFQDGGSSLWRRKNNLSDYIHFCDAFAGGRPCPHLGCAVAVAQIAGAPIERFGLPKDQAELDGLIAMLPASDFKDVSESFDIPYVPEEEEAAAAPAAPASPSKPVPAPKAAASKRDWKVGWTEVESYLKGQGIDRRLLVKIQEKRKAVHDTVMSTPMAIDPVAPKMPYEGPMLERSLRHITMGKSLLLTGDKGAGKDTLINTIAWVLGYPVYLQTGHKGFTSETVVGENMPTGNGLEVAFKYTAFATGVLHGGLTHFAELNMLLPDVTSTFHSVLDDNEQLSTPVGPVPRHKEHLFIGSINVGGHYGGVKSLNAALKDRLAVLQMPYTLDFKLLIEKKTGLTDKHLLQWLEDIKNAIDLLHATEGAGDEARTIRGYIDVATYLQAFGVTDKTKLEALEDFVLNKCEDREERFAIRNQIRMSAWKALPKSKEEEDYENGAA